MTKLTKYFLIFFLKILNDDEDGGSVQCVHVKGSWNTQDFFLFLYKFGFQKTDSRDPYSSGYVYGNISINDFRQSPLSFVDELNSTHIETAVNLTSATAAAFVLVDYDNFYEYYKNSKSSGLKEDMCHAMFDSFNFGKCGTGARDYLKNVNFIVLLPCTNNTGGMCRNSGDTSHISQLSIEIENLQMPKYWYASLIACYLNVTTCEWHHSTQNVRIDYDMWFVNGNPNRSSFDPFVYQFSFDKHDTLELYLLFFVIYTLLVPVQIYAVTRQNHPVTKLFTVSLILEYCGVCFNLLNLFEFAIDGDGLPSLATVGDILDILSRTTFMLLLLLLAKGWGVTRIQLSWRPFVFVIWFLYGIVHVLLYVWNRTEVDIVEEIDEYQTWPGYSILLLRIVIIAWFLFELRNTMKYEHNKRKLDFFLHFGASALVWFIYLPIIAIMSLTMSSLWRYKLLFGITYAADCLAYCIMTHLLWPTRSEQYFLLANAADSGGDELDVFNEAPHVINTYVPSSPALSDSSQCVKLIDLNHYQ